MIENKMTKNWVVTTRAQELYK